MCPSCRRDAGCTSRRSRGTSSRSRRSPPSPSGAGSHWTARGSSAHPEVGPLQLDDDFDRDLLRHIWVLKLADEEAEVLGDPAALGVREVSSRTARAGRPCTAAGTPSSSRRAPSPAIRREPGDAFATAYVVGRNAGFGPAGRRTPCDSGGRVADRADEGAHLDRRRPVLRRPRDGRGRRRGTARSTCRRRPCSTCRASLAAAAAGATVVAVVDAKPPLAHLLRRRLDLARIRPRAARRTRGRDRGRRSRPDRLRRRGTGSSSRGTAACSGARSPWSCPEIVAAVFPGS